MYRLDGGIRVNQQHINLAVAQGALQARGDLRGQLQRPCHFVRALHQQVDVTTVQRVIQPRTEQPNLRVRTRQLGGGGNDGVDLHSAQTHG